MTFITRIVWENFCSNENFSFLRVWFCGIVGHVFALSGNILVACDAFQSGVKNLVMCFERGTIVRRLKRDYNRQFKLYKRALALCI